MAHSVDIAIKARDEASKKFGIVGANAAAMGKVLKGVASTTKTAFATAFRIAERAALGLSAAFAYCTYAAIKQEASEIELMSALKMTGEYSDELMEKMLKQADAIQDATVYGDEYVLTLMRMAMTQGIAADKAADAAKAAIALYEGFGGGRGKPEIFLRYYIDALRGTGASLDSYVGALRNAKTEQERMQVLQKALAAGWDVAKSKADSTGGALKQMKNILGDVAEEIASPYLPAISSAAKAIKNWAKTHKDQIAWWAEVTHSYVTLVKDVFMDFIEFMKNDWRAGMAFVFDSFLRLLKAAFKSAIEMAIAGGRGIWKGVKEGIFGGELEKQYATELAKTTAREGQGGAMGMFPSAEQRERAMRYAEEAIKPYTKREIEKMIKGPMGAITDNFKKAFSDILKDMPEDLRDNFNKAWQKNLDRLKKIGEMPSAGAYAGAGGKEGIPKIFPLGGIGDALEKIISRAKQGLQPLEARLLTFAPGRRFNVTEKNTGDTAKNTKMTYQEIKNLVAVMKAAFQTPSVDINLITSNFK